MNQFLAILYYLGEYAEQSPSMDDKFCSIPTLEDIYLEDDPEKADKMINCLLRYFKENIHKMDPIHFNPDNIDLRFLEKEDKLFNDIIIIETHMLYK